MSKDDFDYLKKKRLKVFDTFGHDEKIENLVYWTKKLQKERATFRKKAVKYDELTHQPTFEECIKEWEERGWEFIDKDGFICFRTKIDNREKDTIIISKEDNEIYFNSKEFNYDLEYEETALCLSFELYNLLTKTLKALEEENNA